MPLITVVVPVYRPSDFRNLEASMRRNEGADVEWIVVDDGSGAQFDYVFNALPKNVKLIRCDENLKQASARNIGIKASSGKWLKFLDADDQLDMGHLAALQSAAESSPDNLLPFAPTKHVFPDNSFLINDSWKQVGIEGNGQIIRHLVRPFLHHCGAIYPKSLIADLNGYNASLVTDEDGDLLLRILERGYRFFPVPTVNYRYIHGSQENRVSSDNDLEKLKSRVAVCDNFLARNAGNISAELAVSLAKRLDKIAVNFCLAYPHEAYALITRAKQLSPGYTPDMHPIMRLTRCLLGVKGALIVVRLYRRLQGRPSGGTQG